MALQSQVYQTMATALPGMPASVIETHYTALTRQATAEVTVGNFVFFDGTDATKVAPSGTGMVAGLVVFTRQYVGAVYTGSLKVAKGSPLQIATNGKFYVTATNASAKVGDYVFASQTDGSISTATANTTQSGKTITNFRVVEVLGTTANSLVLISNQNAAVTVEGAGA